MLIIIFQPYKRSVYNVTDSFLLLSTNIAVSLLTTAISNSENSQSILLALVSVVCVLSFLVPLLYAKLLVLYLIFVNNRRWPHIVFQQLKTLSAHCCGRVAHAASEESLPDRLVHAEEYEQLLPEPVASEEHVWSDEDTY